MDKPIIDVIMKGYSDEYSKLSDKQKLRLKIEKCIAIYGYAVTKCIGKRAVMLFQKRISKLK